MANPTRPIDNWPDLYRPASYIAEYLKRPVGTIRTWAKRGRVRTHPWEATGETLVHLGDARDLHLTSPRRAPARLAGQAAAS